MFQEHHIIELLERLERQQETISQQNEHIAQQNERIELQNDQIRRRDEQIIHLERDTLKLEIDILRQLHHLKPHTPTAITFKEITMLDPVAGNTLVYTGTLDPAGSQFPAGTTFSVTSNYPNVSPTVDPTGLIVTIPLPADFVDDPANPFSVAWASSTFTPQPSTSPASLSAAITPSIPTPPTPTPTGIRFDQTT